MDLACQVDKSLLENSLKVEWRRAETLVHLYEDGKSRAEEQHKDYHKRAHFSKKIKDGNFSLRLKKLRAGDEGVYTCKVYKDQDCVCSVNAALELGKCKKKKKKCINYKIFIADNVKKIQIYGRNYCGFDLSLFICSL